MDIVWRPQAANCTLFDWNRDALGVTTALSPLRNSRILMVGDSLMSQLYYALRSLLSGEFAKSFPLDQIVHLRGELAADGQRQAAWMRMQASSLNITIDYLRNNVLGEHLNEVLPTLSARYDTILVSAGLWYNEFNNAGLKSNASSTGWRPRQRAEYESELRGFGSAVRSQSLQSRIIWLQPSPQHFVGGGSWSGNLSHTCEKRKPEHVARARWRSDVARELLASSGMTLLETFGGLDHLYDSHPFTPAGRKDCTHFCLVGASQLFQTSLVLSHLLWLEGGGR